MGSQEYGLGCIVGGTRAHRRRQGVREAEIQLWSHRIRVTGRQAASQETERQLWSHRIRETGRQAARQEAERQSGSQRVGQAASQGGRETVRKSESRTGSESRRERDSYGVIESE